MANRAGGDSSVMQIMRPAQMCPVSMTSGPRTRRGGNVAPPTDRPAHSQITLTREDLERTFRLKHGNLVRAGWAPRMQRAFDYFNPDDYYEALVAKLIQPGMRWLDVGCGRKIFPSNPRLAQIVAGRCGLLMGVDPSDTLDDNRYVHRKVKQPIEDFSSDEPFDVVTLRMVAEHIAEPRKALASLSRATRPGSRVVVYTVNKWAPVSIAARLIPFRFHHRLKTLVWKVEKRDTFRVVYRMNTRRRLMNVLRAAGFQERYFVRLDDCRASGRFRRLRYVELCCRLLLRHCGLRYPESCLLAVYERR